MKKLFEQILSKRFLLVALFTFLFFILVLSLNIKQGTWLIGWDNLQSELNPWLSLKRSIFSVWEEYQSFGLVSGLAHASDIVRAALVVLMTYILPQSMVRYVFHVTMLFIGGIGFFILFNDSNKLHKNRKYLTIAGSLFYMFNIGTIQLFALPFEPFSIFFAALPFEIWIFSKIIYKKDGLNLRNLGFLIAINLLSTPQAYVQTIFVVYGLILSIIWIAGFVQNKKLYVLRNGIVALIIIILTNSFWLLPQIYFLKTSSSVVKTSKINRMSTVDTFYQNKAKGTLLSYFKINGFYFDMVGMNSEPLFEPWQKHFELPVISLLPFLFTLIVIVGLLSRWRTNAAFAASMVFTTIIFLNATPPFSYITETIYKIDFIAQIFRTPFTKFIVPHVLFMSYFLVYGLDSVLSIILGNHKKYANKIEWIFISLATLAVITYSFPVFQGNLFSAQMKVELPSEYLSLIKYFNKIDKNKRIALLPDYTYWGWFHHKWGYNGSGFLWYGIEQPIISRTFDVWSEKSEAYYWEMKSATESEDIRRVENVAKKYAIDYFIFDKSLRPVTPASELIVYDRLEALLKSSNTFSMVKSFGFIDVYSTSNSNNSIEFINTTDSQLPIIGPTTNAFNKDIGFDQYGQYLSSKSNADVYYPFRDLESQTRNNKSWKIDIDSNNITLSADLPEYLKSGDYDIFVPNVSDETLMIDEKLATISGQFQTNYKSNKIEVFVPKIIIQQFDVKGTVLSLCGPAWGNSKIENSIPNNNDITISSFDGSTGCIGYSSITSLPQYAGYILEVENKNINGRRFFMYVLDNTKKEAVIEDRLTYDTEAYFLPPRFEYGQGYSVNFHNNSYPGMSSSNRLLSLKLSYFPYEAISNIRFVKKGFSLNTSTDSTIFTAKKLNYYTYKVQLPSPSNAATIILDQAYHDGWVAYETNNTWFPFFGKKLTDHVLVNNWANAWRLESREQRAESKDVECTNDSVHSLPAGEAGSQCTVHFVIVFWPQYLQYLGFLILGITISTLGILAWRNHKASKS
ncbi:MAG: hypothetical protein U0525_05205 [Patescibacteria group bacterium]